MSVWDGFGPPSRDEDDDQDDGWADSDDLEDDHAAWRGEVHTGDWPENLAGPEYWLYRTEADEEEPGEPEG